MPGLVALDWGSSSFRAYLLSDNGTIEKKIEALLGIQNIADTAFEKILEQQLAHLAEDAAGLPIIAAGMITSRHGWLETPYVECPATTVDLAENVRPLTTNTGSTIWFVPGVKQCKPHPDIMRGEESQLAGIENQGNRVVVLPGTHCKWVWLENSVIQRFQTFMTGDIFQALVEHTILKAIPPGEWSEPGFLQGVEEGHKLLQNKRTLLSAIFQERVKTILNLSQENDGRSRLSGLLVGSEIAEAIGTGFSSPADTPILVVGSSKLSGPYRQALNHLGYPAVSSPDDLSAKGLYNISCQKKLI